MTLSQKFEEEKNQESTKYFERREAAKSAGNDHAFHLFRHDKSAGNNNQDLARIMFGLHYAYSVLGWDDHKIIDLATGYQASVDGKYHDDYKAVANTEEVDERFAKRRASSMQQPSGVTVNQTLT